jgi:hypothetical protein
MASMKRRERLPLSTIPVIATMAARRGLAPCAAMAVRAVRRALARADAARAWNVAAGDR